MKGRERVGRGARPVVKRRGPEDERDRRRDERRLELVEAAVRVIRREGPTASMDQFAAEAGITKPILYRHFGDRGGLYAAVTAYAFEHLGAGLREALSDLDRTPREVVGRTIDSYLSFIEREPELYYFLTLQAVPDHPGATSEVLGFLDQVARDVAVVLGETLRASGSDSGPAEAWAHGIVGMVFAAAGWWLERRMMPRSRLCAYLTSLVCDGLPGIDDTETTVAEILAGAPAAPSVPRAAGSGDGARPEADDTGPVAVAAAAGDGRPQSPRRARRPVAADATGTPTAHVPRPRRHLT